MVSDVRMTRLAQNQLSQYIGYIKQQFRNPQAAKAVAQDGERLVDMAGARKTKEYKYDLSQSERIGFVFPVYCYTLPDVVLDFVRHLRVTDDRYVFHDSKIQKHLSRKNEV